MAEPPAPALPCPICGRPAARETRPFCSRRCADIDLGRWFAGQYRTPSLRIGDEDEEEPPRDKHDEDD